VVVAGHRLRAGRLFALRPFAGPGLTALRTLGPGAGALLVGGILTGLLALGPGAGARLVRFGPLARLGTLRPALVLGRGPGTLALAGLLAALVVRLLAALAVAGLIGLLAA